MQRKLFALAALASFAGVASAQSSVTIWGVLDASLAHSTGSIASKTQLTNSGLSSSQLGFRGVEDLGDGLAASFWLEAAINNDNGTGGSTNTNNQTSGAVAGGGGLNFGRRSTVSLQGNWGELRIGRDFTPQYRNLAFEPFGNNGIGTGQNANFGSPTNVRASNSITYLWNTSDNGWWVRNDGFFGSAMYYMGENASNAGATKDDGSGYGVRLGWIGNDLHIAGAMSKTKYAAGDVHLNNLHASYNFGVATLIGQYSSDKNGAVSAKGWLVGSTIPVGVGTIRVAYSRYETDAATNPTAKQLALGYVHNLSKRTALYATAARVTNSGSSAVALYGSSTAAGNSSSGYEVGIRHAF
jgi:predicted porin